MPLHGDEGDLTTASPLHHHGGHSAGTAWHNHLAGAMSQGPGGADWSQALLFCHCPPSQSLHRLLTPAPSSVPCSPLSWLGVCRHRCTPVPPITDFFL